MSNEKYKIIENNIEYIYYEEYIKENLSMREIGEKYDCDRTYIGKLFAKHKLSSKPLTKSNRKYNFNENFFDKIDTEEKAYWLGFLYADGCVTKTKNYQYVVSLALSEQDSEHLYKFKNDISAEYQIKHYTRIVNGKEYGYVKISLHSKHLHEAIIKCGCIPKKTFTCTFPSYDIVPIHLMRHFIRGIFDGDGCICITRNRVVVSFAGNINIVSGIGTELYGLGVLQNPPKIIKNKSIYELITLGGYNAECIMNYLYSDATVFLKRKYKKFLTVKNDISHLNYPREHIVIHKCFICGDTNSCRYIVWHGNGEYHNRTLCNKHYEQLCRLGKIADKTPYETNQIICLNNNKIFDSLKEAAEWAGLSSSYGITLCLRGKNVTSGRDPVTNELLKWAKYQGSIKESIENKPEEKQYKRIRERAIYQIDINTNEILNKFQTSTEAGKYLNKKHFSMITACCKGDRKSAFGYKWSYVDEYDSINNDDKI